MALARVSKHHLVACVSAAAVMSDSLTVFAFDDWYHFALLQSHVHEHWARGAGLGSSLRTDHRYTPSTCFETFPFARPTDEQRNAAAAAGQALYEYRSAVMEANQEGMTKTWNRVVDPDDHDPEIVELRRLRDLMDRAVLAAYGPEWAALEPDDRDEIVRRLRRLNAERAAEEQGAD